LLTGATGVVGSALLRRLLDEQVPVRCLVRDPRRLGSLRVRVRISLGDLSDPHSFRNAMRGVDTVAHLATVTRDQPGGTIEELTAMATWRMTRAAERMGVKRFVLLSALGASRQHPARLLRAKAIAEQALAGSALQGSVVATSFVYARDDHWLTLIDRLARLPVVPVPGSCRARCQPIWVEDVAACLLAILRVPADGDEPWQTRYELAGPETLSYGEAIRTVLRAGGHERPLLHVPAPLARRLVHLLERTAGADPVLTWDEAQLLSADALSSRGTDDALGLGVDAQPMSTALGLGVGAQPTSNALGL
jgi:NADH dehydrogenase